MPFIDTKRNQIHSCPSMKCDKTNINMIVIVTCGMWPRISSYIYMFYVLHTMLILPVLHRSAPAGWSRSPHRLALHTHIWKGMNWIMKTCLGLLWTFISCLPDQPINPTCMAWELLLPHCWMLHLHRLHHHHHRCHMLPARNVWFWIFPGHETFTLLESH